MEPVNGLESHPIRIPLAASAGKHNLQIGLLQEGTFRVEGTGQQQLRKKVANDQQDALP